MYGSSNNNLKKTFNRADPWVYKRRQLYTIQTGTPMLGVYMEWKWYTDFVCQWLMYGRIGGMLL